MSKRILHECFSACARAFFRALEYTNNPVFHKQLGLEPLPFEHWSLLLLSHARYVLHISPRKDVDLHNSYETYTGSVCYMLQKRKQHHVDFEIAQKNKEKRIYLYMTHDYILCNLPLLSGCWGNCYLLRMFMLNTKWGLDKCFCRAPIRSQKRFGTRSCGRLVQLRGELRSSSIVRGQDPRVHLGLEGFAPSVLCEQKIGQPVTGLLSACNKQICPEAEFRSFSILAENQ